MSFLVECEDFTQLVEKIQGYGGGTALLRADGHLATFQLSSGLSVTLHRGTPKKWGPSLIVATGSDGHLAKLQERGGPLTKWIGAKAPAPDEKTAYRALG